MDIDSIQGRAHDVLWFSDGNVILATDTLLFKVHKTVLSLQSSVFRDMFAFPANNSNASGSTTNGEGLAVIDGAPVVRLAGDEGEDMEKLLLAVYNADGSYNSEDDDTPLHAITALLTLSSKYDFKLIHRTVVSHIARQYPMNFYSYEEINENRPTLFGKSRQACIFALLKSAFAANLDCLLPILYYASSDFQGHFLLENENELDSRCLRVLLDGKMALESRINKFIARLPGDFLVYYEIDECKSDANCLADGLKLVPMLERYMGLGSLSHFKGRDVVRDCFSERCEDCRSKLEDAIDYKRTVIWGSIPSYFGFTTWEDARKKLDDLLGRAT